MTDLREINEVNFGRFDARLEQRIGALRAEMHRLQFEPGGGGVTERTRQQRVQPLPVHRFRGKPHAKGAQLRRRHAKRRKASGQCTRKSDENVTPADVHAL